MYRMGHGLESHLTFEEPGWNSGPLGTRDVVLSTTTMAYKAQA